MIGRIWLGWGLLVGAWPQRCGEGPVAAVKFRGSQPVTPAPDGTIFCEAEEFAVEKPGWTARPWGENYFAARLPTPFSRARHFSARRRTARRRGHDRGQRRRGGPVSGPGPLRGDVPLPDAVSRADRAGRPGPDGPALWRAGQREDLAFRRALKEGGRLVLGAVENVVWEGHDAYADLESRAGEDHPHRRPATGPQARATWTS